MLTITGLDTSAEPVVPERTLVVSAHPDDVDFGCAGTVAALVAAGSEVIYGIVTDGHAGPMPDDVPRSEAASRRRAEQRAAAKVVGVDDVRFLGFPDGAVEASLELRRELTRLMRDTRPDLVICQSPDRRWDSVFASHPDHLATGESVIRAAYPDVGNPYAFPELLDAGHKPHTVREVWVMNHSTPSHYVDITDHFDTKIAALVAHESQTAMHDLPEMIGAWVRSTAEDAGMDAGRMAESFRVLRVG